MAELDEQVMEGLVKKLGLEKKEVEEAHITFLDKYPDGQMSRFGQFSAINVKTYQITPPVKNSSADLLLRRDGIWHGRWNFKFSPPMQCFKI